MLRLHTFGGLRVDGDGGPLGDVRPRRLALLAILAAAGAKGISRDRLLAILWADSELERARHSLSQALYSLRQDLGVEVVLTQPALRLDPTQITADVDDFRKATASRDWERAADLFAGPFLEGYYLGDAPEFERWADEERSVLSHEAQRALEATAKAAQADGRVEAATEAWRKLSTLDPLNGRIAAAYIEALSGAGEHAKALAHAQRHAERVRRELEVEPDPVVLALIERLRGAGAATPKITTPSPSPLPTPSAAAPSPAVATLAVPIAHARRPVLWLTAAAVVLAGLLVARGVRQRSNTLIVTPAGTHARSPVAERLYADGLRAFYQFDGEAASRLFNDAVKEDSTFAMAVYFAWRSEPNGSARRDSLAARALALAARAPERDRMLISAHVAAARDDLSAVPAADSLVARFPNDPEALIRGAAVTSDLQRAVSLLNRAIGLDSAVSVPTAVCRACDAFHALAARYAGADSTSEVERTLDRWSSARAADFQPWNDRADYLIVLGRVKDAEVAQHHADSLGAPRADSNMTSLIRSLRTDNPDAAASICRQGLAVVEPVRFERFRSLCTIGLRMSGRYHDALGLMREGRNPWSGAVRRNVAGDRVNDAILDMEMWRPLLASVEYGKLAADTARSAAPAGLIAHAVAWGLTLSATAAALGNDTVRARSLVDSVELIGHRSLAPQDPLLHHFIRGVLLAQANQHEEAVREFRAAMASPVRGYSRINYELGRSLIALHRPIEAVPVLRAGLRGELEDQGQFVTRTDMHERLAQAFDAAGQRDSAAAHYAVVERVWRGADPFLAPRYEAARQWLLRSGRAGR